MAMLTRSSNGERTKRAAALAKMSKSLFIERSGERGNFRCARLLELGADFANNLNDATDVTILHRRVERQRQQPRVFGKSQ